jgi:branched-chain amino acid aminotransferase
MAQDMGLKVERRHIHVDEIGQFEEAGACGTAAVISPIGEIQDRETGKVYTFGNGEAGPWSTKLYKRLQAIQYGEEADKFGWCSIIE